MSTTIRAIGLRPSTRGRGRRTFLLQGATVSVVFAVLAVLTPVAAAAQLVPGTSGTEVILANSCLAGNGRVDVNLVNNTGAEAVYRIELGTLSARQLTVAPGDYGRMPYTGRPEGDLPLRITENGNEIHNDVLVVSCDEPPFTPAPDVQVINSCRDGNGFILFQFVNNTIASKAWIIEFEGVANRSTTTAAGGAAVRGVAGRPDGDYGVLIRSGRQRITMTVTVDCDPDDPPPQPEALCSSVDAEVADCQQRQDILSIRMFPRDPNDATMIDPWTGQNRTVVDLESHINAQEDRALELMTESTRFRGHSDPTAEPALIYQRVLTVALDMRPPEGLEVPWKPGEGIYRPDYDAILTLPRADICAFIEDRGIDEVWLWTQHYGSIEPAESNMSSPAGQPFVDISNSERSDDLPHCSKTYVVYNFTYDRGADTLLHNHGHHMEAMLSYRPADRQLFRFDGYMSEDPIHPHLPTNPLGWFRCGSGHYSPNASSIEHEYVSFLTDEVLSDCETWEPGGGTPELVSCSNWFEPIYGSADCFDDGQLSYQVWWFQNLPGMRNGLDRNGFPMRNVWETFKFPDLVLTDPSHLFEDVND